MTDQTSNLNFRTKRSHGKKLEYRFYFAVIMVAAIPFALAFWLRDLLTLNDEALRKGVLARARAEAQNIAPRIFFG